MAFSKSLIGAIMRCQDCDWECEDYMIAQRNASNHAQAEGHCVSGETVYYVRYGEPKESAETKE